MKTRILMTVLLVAFFSIPAAADEFYIVQNPSTKRCSIVDKKPNTTTIVGDTSYKTRTDAESALSDLKTSKACHDVSSD